MGAFDRFGSSRAGNWSKDLWDGLIQAIDARFAPLEEQVDAQKQAADAVVARGLQIIEDNLTPVLNNANDILDVIEADQASAGGIVADMLAAVQALSEEGVPSSAVSTTTSRRFTSDTEINSKLDASQKAAVNGVASLGADGKVPSGQLPSSPVSSVAGKTGAVTLAAEDITDSGVTGRSLLSAASAAAAKAVLSVVAADIGDAGTFGRTLVQAASAAVARAALGMTTLGQTLAMVADAAAARAAIGVVSPTAYALLQDQKSSGTDGGTFTSGAWRTRDLNTKVYDPDGLITLASNEFTPSADGTVEWSAPAFVVTEHQSRLYNVTDATEVIRGTSETSEAGGITGTRSFGSAQVVAGKTYRIEHRCSVTNNSDGFGLACGFGGTEVYTEVRYRRTA